VALVCPCRKNAGPVVLFPPLFPVDTISFPVVLFPALFPVDTISFPVVLLLVVLLLVVVLPVVLLLVALLLVVLLLVLLPAREPLVLARVLYHRVEFLPWVFEFQIHLALIPPTVQSLNLYFLK
jgi:hypothetical protein